MPNYATWSAKMWNVWNEYYLAAFNGMLMMQQEWLNVNRAVMNQLEANRRDSRKFYVQIENHANRGQQLYQEAWRDSLSANVTNMNLLREATDASIDAAEEATEDFSEAVGARGRTSQRERNNK